MRVLMINSGVIGSTGSIMLDLASTVREAGHQCITACAAGKSMRKEGLREHIYIGNRLTRNLHSMVGKISGYHGLFSLLSTELFLYKVKKFRPDVIHLHNLHDCYINLPMLFRYIKKYNIKVVWTLHDCWSFTGGCPHFTLKKCDKWKTGCFSCPSYKSYPASYFDRSKAMWILKKKWFTGVKDLSIITPSQWLAKLVKQSFLSSYPVEVINNGINLDIFKPTPSNFRSSLPEKKRYILLGVAFNWGNRKGLDVIIELATRLPSDYQIVLVGTNDEIDKLLPDDILSIHKTTNQYELAEIYTMADLLVNPTREENYPTVNMESIACGTPVLTFRTGGSPEILDEKTGYVVDVDDIDEMEKQIIRICTEKVFNEKDCVERAKTFNKSIKYNEYLKLYTNKDAYGTLL